MKIVKTRHQLCFITHLQQCADHWYTHKSMVKLALKAEATHRSDSIRGTDYVTTQVEGFLGQQ